MCMFLSLWEETGEFRENPLKCNAHKARGLTEAKCVMWQPEISLALKPVDVNKIPKKRQKKKQKVSLNLKLIYNPNNTHKITDLNNMTIRVCYKYKYNLQYNTKLECFFNLYNRF